MSAAPVRGLKSGRAKILTPDQFNRLLHHVQVNAHRTPFHALRDFAILLFSYKGALRACEIVALNWRNVMDAEGSIGEALFNPTTQEIERFFEVPNGAAKKSHGRKLPMHPGLEATLIHLRKALGDERTRPNCPVIQSTRSPKCSVPIRMSSKALVLYLIDLYERCGLDGSSHSGRRTAITKLTQVHGQHNCSLIDVQHFAGHADLKDTQAYVEHSPFAWQMVRSL